MQLQFAPVTIDFAQIVSVAPDQVKTLKDLPHFMFDTVCQATAKPIRIFGRIDHFNVEVLTGNRRLAYTLMAQALADAVVSAAASEGLVVTISDPTPEEIKEKEAELSRGGFRMAATIQKDLSALMDLLEETIRTSFNFSTIPATISSEETDTIIRLPIAGPVSIALNTYGKTQLYNYPIAKTKLMATEYFVHIHSYRYELQEALVAGGFLWNLDHAELQRQFILALDLAFPWMLMNDHRTNAVLDFKYEARDCDLPGHFLELKKRGAARFNRVSDEQVARYVEQCEFMANPTES